MFFSDIISDIVSDMVVTWLVTKNWKAPTYQGVSLNAFV